MVQSDDPPVTVNQDDIVPAEALPSLLDGYDFLIDDHTFLPTEAMRKLQDDQARDLPGHRRAILHEPGRTG